MTLFMIYLVCQKGIITCPAVTQATAIRRVASMPAPATTLATTCVHVKIGRHGRADIAGYIVLCGDGK